MITLNNTNLELIKTQIEFCELKLKYIEIIEAQDELLEIDKKGFKYLQERYGRLSIPYSQEMEQALKRGTELRQKVKQLKNEI